MPKRVAVYVRVSTDTQNTAAQRQEPEAWAERELSHATVTSLARLGRSASVSADRVFGHEASPPDFTRRTELPTIGEPIHNNAGCIAPFPSNNSARTEISCR
jgi:hypothetical protein